MKDFLFSPRKRNTDYKMLLDDFTTKITADNQEDSTYTTIYKQLNRWKMKF